MSHQIKMIENKNNTPTIKHVALASFSIEVASLAEDVINLLPFQAVYQYIDKEGALVGTFVATPDNFLFTPETVKKIYEALQAIENDRAISLFGEQETPAIEPEEKEIIPKRSPIDWPELDI